MVRVEAFAGLLAVLSFASVAAADGLRVTRATYGAGGKTVDATRFVATECNGRMECSYAIDHVTLTDPASGVAKSFEVEYECAINGESYKKTVEAEASGKTLELACPGIRIDNAEYGPPCAGTKDATEKVAAVCNGRNACAFSISHVDLGDPAPACAKGFRAAYRCERGGPVRNASVEREASGKKLEIDCKIPVRKRVPEGPYAAIASASLSKLLVNDTNATATDVTLACTDGSFFFQSGHAFSGVDPLPLGPFTEPRVEARVDLTAMVTQASGGKCTLDLAKSTMAPAARCRWMNATRDETGRVCPLARVFGETDADFSARRLRVGVCETTALSKLAKVTRSGSTVTVSCDYCTPLIDAQTELVRSLHEKRNAERESTARDSYKKAIEAEDATLAKIKAGCGR